MQVGTDEAGKGPVLGSMFAAAVRVESGALPEGVADSKKLSATRRRELAAAIREQAAATAVVEVPVERIDDPDTDMNSLTVAAHADALAVVAGNDQSDRTDGTPDHPEDDTDGLAGVTDERGCGRVTAYLDAADTNAVRFERRVGKRVDSALDLRAEHGADETYPAVGAASILAKVRRDAHVTDLTAEYGEVGSGYPGDPTTREFLREFVANRNRLPACARDSWQTSHDVLAEQGQAALSDFEREDRQGQRSLSEF